MGENGEDFDFGTAAMRMLEGIRRNDEDDPRNQRIEEVEEPESPTPQGSGGGMILTAEPGDSRRSVDTMRARDAEEEERRSISSTRQLLPKEEVDELKNHEVKEEESDGLEYVDADDLKEED